MWPGTRPSALLAMCDPVLAFLMDEAIGSRLLVSRLRGAKAPVSRLERGLRYAEEADYNDPWPAEAPGPSPFPELAGATA